MMLVVASRWCMLASIALVGAAPLSRKGSYSLNATGMVSENTVNEAYTPEFHEKRIEAENVMNTLQPGVCSEPNTWADTISKLKAAYNNGVAAPDDNAIKHRGLGS